MIAVLELLVTRLGFTISSMLILGIDEVGRGSWAGPLVVGAVALAGPIAGLADSKLLSAAKRRELDRTIRLQAVYVGLGWVSADELDAVGLSVALKLAAERAVEGCIDNKEVIIDGKVNFLLGYDADVKTLIKADQTIPAVSAASIVAKVARDAFMADLDSLMPGYGFKTNVGYGTKQHREGLRRLGVSIYHRQSFQPMKNMVSRGL